MNALGLTKCDRLMSANYWLEKISKDYGKIFQFAGNRVDGSIITDKVAGGEGIVGMED